MSVAIRRVVATFIICTVDIARCRCALSGFTRSHRLSLLCGLSVRHGLANTSCHRQLDCWCGLSYSRLACDRRLICAVCLMMCSDSCACADIIGVSDGTDRGWLSGTVLIGGAHSSTVGVRCQWICQLRCQRTCCHGDDDVSVQQQLQQQHYVTSSTL